MDSKTARASGGNTLSIGQTAPLKPKDGLNGPPAGFYCLSTCGSFPYRRQARSSISREEIVGGSWCCLVAWSLMAVAACVRRFPSLASKSSVLTLWAQWLHRNFTPFLTSSVR